MCAHKFLRSLHKYKINLHPQIKHVHQLRMKSKLKKMRNKFKTMNKLKMKAWIKGDGEEQEKEDGQKIQAIKAPHPRVRQAIQRDHPVDMILGDIQKGVI
jgi:hypothetical protein